MTTDPQPTRHGSRRAVSRSAGMAMAAEAATFAIASAVHFATDLRDAAIPELVIAIVLGLGSLAVASRRPRARGIAVGATAFAAFGTIAGLTVIATGRQDIPDLSYHATILAAFAVTLAVPLRRAAAQACLDGVATQPVKLYPASTLVGRSRTISSPGTPLRFPSSSARSGPI